MRETYSIVRDPAEYREDVTVRGRWERVNPTVTDQRFRHYIRVAGCRIRVPWILWAMFS